MALRRSMDLQKKKKMGICNVTIDYQEVWIWKKKNGYETKYGFDDKKKEKKKKTFWPLSESLIAIHNEQGDYTNTISPKSRRDPPSFRSNFTPRLINFVNRLLFIWRSCLAKQWAQVISRASIQIRISLEFTQTSRPNRTKCSDAVESDDKVRYFRIGRMWRRRRESVSAAGGAVAPRRRRRRTRADRKAVLTPQRVR